LGRRSGDGRVAAPRAYQLLRTTERGRVGCRLLRLLPVFYVADVDRNPAEPRDRHEAHGD
jgi:hypothetical protein